MCVVLTYSHPVLGLYHPKLILSEHQIALLAADMKKEVLRTSSSVQLMELVILKSNKVKKFQAIKFQFLDHRP